MDTSSISSNKITLKISTPQGREMTLNKGELLQAQVQEVGEDGSVTILVKGKPVEAFSEVLVKPGQQLLLMVDELKQGKTYLKVVTPELMGKIEHTNMSANLVGMGVAAREENIRLARKLLQYNLPVTPKNLSELSRNASSLGGMNAKNLEIGAFALSRGISGQDALASLARFLSSAGETARLMPALERLAQILTAANANGEIAGQAASLKNTASAGNTVSSAEAVGIAFQVDAETENFAATARNSSIPHQSAGRNQSNDSTSPSVTNRPAVQSGQGNQLFNAVMEAENTTPLNRTSGSQNLSSAGNTFGMPAASENDLPATKIENQLAHQTVVAKNSSLSPGAGNIESGSGEAQAMIQSGSKAETVALPKNVQPDTAVVRNTVNGEDLAAGVPKPATDGIASQATAAAARSGSAADSSGRTAPINNEEPLSRSGSREAIPTSGQPSPSGGEKPTAVNQRESGSLPKPDSSGTASRNLPAAAGTENNGSQTVVGNKAGFGPAGTAASPETVTAGPANTAADRIGQAVIPQVGLDESIPTTIPHVGEDRVDIKTATQGVAAEIEAIKQNMASLLDAVRSLMELDLQETPEKIAGKLQNSRNFDKEIVKALSLLVDMGKNPEIADKIPELKDFSLSFDRLEKEMFGQQLFNLSSRSAVDNLSAYYYFAFPVKIDQEYSLCQLKINKDGNKSLKDVDKLSFVVSLNTSKLGLVLFHINWQRSGSLQLQGLAENQASSNFLNQNIGELVSKLEELGYSVKNMGIKVSSSAEELQIRPVLQKVTERLRPLGIDVTV